MGVSKRVNAPFPGQAEVKVEISLVCAHRRTQETFLDFSGTNAVISGRVNAPFPEQAGVKGKSSPLSIQHEPKALTKGWTLEQTLQNPKSTASGCF
jgi:hypothetical protein